MAYIGREPLNGFFSKQTIANDGSTTTFALTHGIASTTAIIVSVNAVVLEPDVGYTLSGGGTNIIFASAPNATTYIHYLGESVQQSILDVNGVEFILDLDGDTSLTADTDDEIDIKVGGTDRSTIKATGFHNIDSIKFVAGTSDDMQMYHDGSNSYITNATGALKIATETSGIAITIGHSTSEITIADNMTVAGDLTVTGTTSFADTNITNVGSIALDTITNDGTDITLDSSGDIILDAGGDTIFLKDSGTTFGSLDNSSSDLIIKSGTTTAATFSGANVTFAGTIGSGAITSTGIVTGSAFTAGSAVLAEAELELLDGLTAGTAIASKVVTTDANIDTTGQRNLTISGELDAATGDFSGDVDVDGTLEADAITINSTAIGSIYGVIAGSSSIVTTGALDSGSITSGFGAIDNGTSNIRSATITAETAFVPDASGGADLGTTALEFNDLFLNDSGSIQFGDDQDTTLVHTDGTGLTLNSTNKLCFNDASQFVQGSSATVLSIGATDEIDLTATAIDINGTCDVSGTLTNSSAAVKVAGKETMWIPATAMYASTTNGAEATQTELTAGYPELKTFDFDTSTAESIQFNVSFPKSWDEGVVTFQTFWSASATDTGTGGFTLAGCSVASDVDYDLAFGTPVANTALAASGTQDDLMVNVVSGDVTIASAAADTNTIFRLVRDTGTDTNTGDLRLVGIKLFYTTNAANDA